MLKTFLTFLITLYCFSSLHAYDPSGRRHYHLALHATSPLSLMSKGGGELELRNGNFSTLVQYTKYWNAFAGKQYGMEFQKYFNSRKPHQYYMYLKLVTGESTFDNKKLSIIGQTQDIVYGPIGYAGGGGGFGRRYNFNVFFVRWNLGLKYCLLTDAGAVDEYDKSLHNMFRLFYFTGPGAILEANFHFGIQL